MKWEITNPSDKATMESDSFAAAVCANCFLSNGKYGLKPMDGGERMPVFLFGGACEWIEETFGLELGELIKQNLPGVVAALRSVSLVYDQTSLNDIAGRAHNLAAQLEGKEGVTSDAANL